ncbi:MAG: sel1 repeat family protein [Labilithrix sp.]|nr:sel1 repeat family protein [Labilithrix sp.]
MTTMTMQRPVRDPLAGERFYRLAEAEERSHRTRWSKYFALLRAAAECGHVAAHTELATSYLAGFKNAAGATILPRSPTRARKLFEVAAKAGDTNAFSGLAYCFDAGVGGPRSEKQALYWYRRAVAHGSIIASYNISTIYRDRGDRAGRVRWLRRTIAMGDTGALVELGRLVLFRPGRRTTKATLVANILRLARSEDEESGAAMLLLADAYERGAGVPQSEKRAAEWRSRAGRAAIESSRGTVRRRST